MNTRHTFAKYLTNFANTNSRQNVANVSLLDHVLSILDMWLVLVNYVLTLKKVSAVADWAAPRDIKGV